MTLDSFCVCLTDKFGQRAFVGKVCMDMNNTVPEYKETTEESLKETERYVCLDLSCGRSLCCTDGLGDGERFISKLGEMNTYVTLWVCPTL